jgi:hypothetical protein
MCRQALAVDVEDDPLALSHHPEYRAFERVGGQFDLGAIGLPYDDAHPGPGVVRLDHALQRFRLSGR